MKSNITKLMSLVALSSLAIACSPAENQESAQPLIAENSSGNSNASPQDQRSVDSSKAGSAEQSAKEESAKKDENFDIQDYLDQQREERQANAAQAAEEREASQKRQQQLELMMLVSQMNLMKQGLKLAGGEEDFDLFEVPESLKALMGMETYEEDKDDKASETQVEAEEGSVSAGATEINLPSATETTGSSPEGAELPEAPESVEEAQIEVVLPHEDCEVDSAIPTDDLESFFESLENELPGSFQYNQRMKLASQK